MADHADVFGYQNNIQRVFVTLLDGRWHAPEELGRVGGVGYARRVRELGSERCGNLKVLKRKTKGDVRYRLDLASVTPEWQQRILTNNLPSERKASKKGTKPCPTCKGSGRVSEKASPGRQPAWAPVRHSPTGKSSAPGRWNDVFEELLTG